MSRTQVREAPGRAAIIRPVQDADLAALGGFFAGLSPRSRYQRFFAPITPSQVMLRGLSGSAGADALIALHAGVIIGHAMAADTPGPGGEREADIGVVVADRWQGQGVGSALVRELTRRAQIRGVMTVTMDVLHANQQVLAMITAHWPAARIDRGADCLTARVRLPQPGRQPRTGQPGQPGERHRTSSNGQRRQENPHATRRCRANGTARLGRSAQRPERVSTFPTVSAAGTTRP